MNRQTDRRTHGWADRKNEAGLPSDSTWIREVHAEPDTYLTFLPIKIPRTDTQDSRKPDHFARAIYLQLAEKSWDRYRTERHFLIKR